MDEFAEILRLDDELREIKAQIAALKKQADLLQMQRDRLAIEGAPILSQVTCLEAEGMGWTVQKGRPSVHLKPEITVLSLPENFIRKAPDKPAMLRAYRQSPELIESFADIEYSPDKLTYKLI